MVHQSARCRRVLAASPAYASPLSVELVPTPGNPASPQMGDTISFSSVIRNIGDKPLRGVIAWVSLIQVDPGQEQPVDLEDWSAHKAITQQALFAGGSIVSQWPVRLMQSGRYRVVVSATTVDSVELTASQFTDFQVRPKPVVVSRRVVPIAMGIPLLILGLLTVGAYRRRRG